LERVFLCRVKPLADKLQVISYRLVLDKNIKMNTYRNLIVWQKSIVLVTEVYKATFSFPKEELFSLTSQIRRSSISVPSNIAEGFGRQHKRDYTRFLQISRGSLYELQTQIEIAGNLNFLNENILPKLLESCNEIEKMLNRLITIIEQNDIKPRTSAVPKSNL
jgi:four helix bundle protein